VDLTYTAGAQNWVNGGLLRVVIPAGLAAPQGTNLNAANAVKVLVTGGSMVGTPVISGQTVDVVLASLAAGTGKVVVIYGFKATPSTGGVDLPMTEGNYVFQVESDPLNDGSLKGIATQPALSLVRPSVDCDVAAALPASVGSRVSGSVKGLGEAVVVVAPNPARAGQMLCVSLGSAAKRGAWTIYDLAGNPVAKAEFGPGAGECYSPSKLASGVYFIKIDYETLQGGNKTVTRKVAIIQ
jgi:hypothetical protein